MANSYLIRFVQQNENLENGEKVRHIFSLIKIIFKISF